MSQEAIDFLCPNCGYKLGEQQLFQQYEQRVAEMLRGERCADFNPGFDVQNCQGFPGLTFQVKYAKVQHRNGAARSRDRYPVWGWTQGSSGADSQPDYFVLFGILDNGREYCFLLSAKQWVNLSSRMGNGKGGRLLFMRPHRFSRRCRGVRSPGYVHENKGWGYEVRDPEKNLVGAIKDREGNKQLEMDW